MRLEVTPEARRVLLLMLAIYLGGAIVGTIVLLN